MWSVSRVPLIAKERDEWGTPQNPVEKP
jgi:hypothetical protein